MNKVHKIPLKNQIIKQMDPKTHQMKVISNWDEVDDLAYVEWEDEEEKVP